MIGAPRTLEPLARAPRGLLVGLLLGLIGCADDPPVTFEGPVSELECGRPELIYAAQGPAGGVFGGLDGALEPGTQAVLRTSGGAELARVEADEHGRFSASHEVAVGDEIVLDVCGAQLDFRVRDPEVARTAAVRPSLGGVGAVPNDLIMLGAGAQSRGVVVRSGDNAVSVVEWDSGIEGGPLGVRLPEVEGADGPVPANPWLAAGLDDARVVVSAWAQDRLYVIDVLGAEVQDTLEGPAAVTLDAPFVLPEAFDVDGDGTPETEVTTFRPRTPQPVTVVQGRLLVGFANLLRVDRGGAAGQLALPAVLASYDLSNLAAPPTVAVLPHLNPQEIRADGAAALVTCSGLFRISGLSPVTPGAVYRIDPVTLDILQSRTFESFLPTTAISAAGAVWTGSLARAAVRRFSWDGTPSSDLSLNDEGVDSVFRLFELPGGLLGAPSFNTDRLHVIDPRARAVDPAPFFGPLPVGPGGDIFAGLQIVARRGGRAGVDFVGPDLMALSGLAASVRPIELRKILGP